MPGLLDGAVALLDRRRLTSVWVPLAAFLAAVAGVVAAGAGWGTTMPWWNGLAADTPVMVAVDVSLPGERLIRGRLSALAFLVEAVSDEAPTVLLIGEAVGRGGEPSADASIARRPAVSRP